MLVWFGSSIHFTIFILCSLVCVCAYMSDSKLKIISQYICMRAVLLPIYACFWILLPQILSILLPVLLFIYWIRVWIIVIHFNKLSIAWALSNEHVFFCLCESILLSSFGIPLYLVYAIAVFLLLLLLLGFSFVIDKYESIIVYLCGGARGKYLLYCVTVSHRINCKLPCRYFSMYRVHLCTLYTKKLVYLC